MNRNESYTIFRWMSCELGLHGAELSTYAYIYQFTQAPGCYYFGSLKQIADFVGYSHIAVRKAISRLCNDEIILKSIERDKNGALKTAYRVNLEKVR